MNANGNTAAAQGKASSNSTIFTRSNRSEFQQPDVEMPVLKFFRTLSEETDTSPENVNSSHGTSVEVNGNERTAGGSSAVGVVQKNGESTTHTTVVRTNERKEVFGTEGCRELESVDGMPPGTSCSVDCDRNGGLAQWIPKAQSDIMDLEEENAKDYIADNKTHLQGYGGSTDQSDGCIPERTSHLQGYVEPMDSLKNELRVSIDKHRNSGASDDYSREEPIDTDTQCATGSTNQDVDTDCPSTDQSETTDQQRLYRSTDKIHQDILKSDEITNTDDKYNAKDVRNNTDESTDKHNILTWLTDSETNPASSSTQETCTDDKQIQDLPTPDDDLTRDLANPTAVRAGKPQDLPTPDDDLTRDLANPTAVRAGKPQALPTPDDDLTRDLANPTAVRAEKPQDLPTPDDDLTRDLANPTAVRAGKPQDLPTPDDDLTRDLANPTAVRAGKPQALPTPDDDLTRDLANPTAVRAGKPQALPTPDDDLTRDLANPTAVRAEKPQDLPTPDDDLTRDLANPTAVRAEKPQDLPTPDDDLTRDLANPTAVRAEKPQYLPTPDDDLTRDLANPTAVRAGKPQYLPTPDDDLTRDLANPTAVRAGKPQYLPTPDDDLTRDLANPTAVRAGKPQDLPTPDDDLTRDLANPTAVRAEKPQYLPTPDDDLTRDLANPTAVRAGKPQDLPTPDDDLTRDLANPTAVRAGKPDTSGTPSSNNTTVILTMIRTEPVSEEQQHTVAETETVVGTTGQTEEPGCGSSIEVKVRGETYPHSDSDSITGAVVETGETDTENDRVVSCPSETMLSSEVTERAPAEAKSTAGPSHPTSPQGPTSTPGPTSGPPPGTTSIRATFSLGSPVEKPLQLPALFSGLRTLKKGAAGSDQDIVALIKPPSPSDLGVNKPVRREQKTVRRRQGTFLDQLSQFLNMEKDDNSKMKESTGEESKESTGEESKESTGEEMRESTGEERKESTGQERKESTGEERKESKLSEESKEFSDEPEEVREVKEKTEKDTETEKTEQDTEKEKTEGLSVIKPPESSEPSETLEPKEPQKPPSRAEVAFDEFKAFFVPRPLRRDQDAVKRKAWIFERTFKTPEKKTDSKLRASTPGDGEDRSTPGRLQAIWPPTKEEKVGLKYTEAEHQAALLQLKRECNEEMEKIQEDFGKQLRQVRGDNEERVFHLECNLARLQSDLALGAHHRRGDLRDVAVSTGDDLSQRTVHNVCVQTDHQTFIRTPEDEEGGVRLGPQPPLNVPKRLGLASISLNLSGQATSPSSPSSSPLPPPPPPPPFPKQTQGLDGPPPTSLPGCSPPPPPQPPGCVPPPPPGVLVDKPHRKPAVEPACPMKPLYWTRIQIQDNKDTLWNSLVEPDIINTTEFEDLFSKTTLQTKKKPLSEAYEKKAKAKKVIKLLDGKRSQAVGILISSLHLEMNDIQQAVLMVDNSIVDMETIQALYENVPL
ncbi:uncharacterized protein LOC112235639 isoform X2 [Oncorhynchus tshawytscha]|uniref:uncharacterized protein LOC112235639 isoform X2 n=1 Tax=Oncorhynchus tshawytscha TaxID=74940 RepID=UPI001C3C66C6|nr:uncharacterized protein LOC112235639 isoform X2 [Oncorhynchus tshawytscha]